MRTQNNSNQAAQVAATAPTNNQLQRFKDHRETVNTMLISFKGSKDIERLTAMEKKKYLLKIQDISEFITEMELLNFKPNSHE